MISCVRVTLRCQYSLLVYDIESDGTVYTSRSAYQTLTSIIGLPLLSPSITYTSYGIVSTDSPHYIATTTVLLSTPEESSLGT